MQGTTQGVRCYVPGTPNGDVHESWGTTMKRLLAAAFCAAALVGISSSAALAGEVKGPPGTVDNTNETGALDHANSACAASGLNDLDSDEGQNERPVQTAADSWLYYGFEKGDVGRLGLCAGGTGETDE